MNRLTVLLLLVCGAGHASTLFEGDSVLEISLQGPLSSVLDDLEERREREFIVTSGGQEIKAAVRVRGKSRTELCYFPPLRLNFSAYDAHGSIFEREDKLKLVTHCKGSSRYEANLVEEYAVYRIMNVLSELSLRVRLLRIRYVDTDRPDAPPELRYGFLVESDVSLADRLGAATVDRPSVAKGLFDPQHSALVYVFQYLVGNTDWSFVRAEADDTCCHNGKIIKAAEQHYYLPYDFDMSGLVNASYATPNPRLRLMSVRIRRYRGYCIDEAFVREALRTVTGARPAILNIIAELPLLSAREIEAGSRYLQKFFDRAAREDKLLREIRRRCLD